MLASRELISHRDRAGRYAAGWRAAGWSRGAGWLSAAWSASAIASWPAAVGWNGAGELKPFTNGWAVHSWCPAKSGCGEENWNWAAPLASTVFSVARREVSVCRFVGVRPARLRHPGWAPNGL